MDKIQKNAFADYKRYSQNPFIPYFTKIWQALYEMPK
jgi:hypothetical protein